MEVSKSASPTPLPCKDSKSEALSHSSGTTEITDNLKDLDAGGGSVCLNQVGHGK